MSIRAVIDTNVFISIILNKTDSPSRQIYKALQAGQFTSVLSEAIVREIDEVTNRPRIRKLIPYTDREIENFTSDFIQISAIVPSMVYSAVGLTDPDDNIIIACALTGQADFIVTGDKKHLLPLKTYEGIHIVTPRAFLEVLDKQI